MPDRGALLVAYGEPALCEAREAVKSLLAHNPLPVRVVTDSPAKLPGVETIDFPDSDPGARLAKLSIDLLSPFNQTLYIDADTRVRGDLSAGFQMLDDGWEMVISHSKRQGIDVLGNLTTIDRGATFDALGVRDVLGLQAGVFFWRNCEATRALFAAWRAEWAKFKRHDQGALLRALQVAPARVWLVGRAYSNGVLVEHRFGRAVRA